MAVDAAIIGACLAVALVLFHPRVSRAKGWRATVTPLASIIGSGFLVIGPILESSYGYLAPLGMVFLCVAAWMFGAAIRANIARLDATGGARSALEERLEVVASWVLTLAYVISVAYYLNLFGAFSVRLTEYDGAVSARLVTTAAFVLIAYVGWTRGFTALEGMEKVSVALKLSIVAGLLTGLAIHFWGRAREGALALNPPVETGWAGLALLFGLIVTVQGFETSRYLSEDYDASTRIVTMRRAQIISAGIYMVYILLLSYLFEAGSIPLSETAIIPMMKIVAPILPALLVAAALAAQFSAAVADTAGSGGLIAELTRGRVSPHLGYVFMTAVGVAMTWSLNVFEIITVASRAFALYYAFQAAIAAAGASREGRRGAAALWAALAAFGFLVCVAGAPVEA